MQLKKARSKAVQREQPTIKQERGQVSYNALIDAGFKLLETHDIDDIAIADLTRKAGYSVGAFYGRFRSKDEFFDALVEKHIELRTQTQQQLVQLLPVASLVDDLVANIVNYYWTHQIFWRAVLRRSLRDPSSWEPFRVHFNESVERFVQRLQQDIGRSLSDTEHRNLAFAFQTVMGLVNIAVVNQPGPVFIGQTAFIEELSRAFRLISGIDVLLQEEGSNPLSRR